MMKQPPPPRNSSNSPEKDNYRPGVGIVLFNAAGHVLIAKRIDPSVHSWQLPQGGIDAEENPEIAVFREMEEEIGTRNAKIIGMVEDWISYDFPAYVIKKLNTPYRGQRHKWIALQFLGDDNDIRLDAHTEPEFEDWKWIPIDELLDYVVGWKRPVYERVIKEFFKYSERLKK